MGVLEFELNPPNGITGFPLGIPAETVRTSAAELGEVSEVGEQDEDGTYRPGRIIVEHPQFEIIFHTEDGKTLTAVEFSFPHSGPDDVTVRFRGIDVFQTPVRELYNRLREMGLTVLEDSPHAYVPRLSLGFSNYPDDEIPEDVDGEPLYLKAILTGPTDYYDNMPNSEDFDDKISG